MDCNFQQKKQTKFQKLEGLLDRLNEDLGLRKDTIHGYYAYGGVLLATGTNDILYGVDRMSEGKMIDVVVQCLSVINYAKRHNEGIRLKD